MLDEQGYEAGLGSRPILEKLDRSVSGAIDDDHDLVRGRVRED
jgi:hypothetical protein